MENRTFDINKLRVAKIKYFDSKDQSCRSLPDGLNQPYVFLYNFDGKYINIFDPLREYPVYEETSLMYADNDGIDRGSLIFQVSGERKDGPIYLMHSSRTTRDYFKNDKIDYNQLKKCILFSSSFFIERPKIIMSLPLKERIGYLKKFLKDIRDKYYFKEYLLCCEKGYQYKKNNN